MTHRVRQILQSLVARGALQICLVLSGILLARSLGPAARGDLAIVVILPTVATQLVVIGIPSAITYYIAKNREAWLPIVRQLPTMMALQMVLAAVVFVGLSRYFLAGKDGSSHAAGMLAMASIPFLVVQHYGLHVLQGLGDLHRFNFYSVLPFALFTIGLVPGVFAGLTVETSTVIWLASILVATTALAHTLIKRARRSASRIAAGAPVPDKNTIVRFGAAGFLAQVSPVETFRIDTLAVAVLFPSLIVGYYTVASSVSNVPRFIADGLVAVAYPHIAEQDSRPGIASTNRYMLAALALCGTSAIVVALTLPYVIPLLFGRRFEPAVGVGAILVIAAGLISIRRVGTDCLRALGRPGASTRTELVTLGALAAGLVWLGPWGDGKGVALSLAISAGVGLGLILGLLKRFHAESTRRGGGLGEAG